MASNPAAQLESRFLRGWRPNLFYFALFVPLLVLIFRDRSVWPWDEAFYATYSVSLFQTLQNSPLDWPSAMVHALGDRAPAISWLGQFFVGLVPSSLMPDHVQNFLLLTNWLAHFTAILLLYRILRKIFGPGWPAFLTCCVALASPLLTGLTYNFLVEPLQMWSVVWVLGVVAYRDRLTKLMIVMQVMSAVAFGLLAKTSTPVFQMPLLLYAAYALVTKPAAPAAKVWPAAPKVWNDWRHISIVLTGTVLVVAGAAAWYLVNFHAAMQHVMEAASGSQSTHYGSKGPLGTKLMFWTTQFQRGFFWPPLLATLALAIPFAFRQRSKQKFALSSADILAAISITWIAVVLFLFARSVNEDTRFLLALLPYVAILVCWLAANVQSLPWRAIIAGLTALQFVLVTAQSYGMIQPRESFSNYLSPLVTDDLAQRDTIFAAKVTADSTPANGTVAGMERPEFNAVGLLFYSTADGHSFNGRWSYMGADWTQADSEKVWRWVLTNHCKYYVFRQGAATNGFDTLNSSSKIVLRKVSASPDFHLRPDKSNGRIIVYERTVHGRPRFIMAAPVALGVTAASIAPVESGFQSAAEAPGLPFGIMESPKLASPVLGSQTLQVIGWTAAVSEISRVQILLDGKFVQDADKNARPDVMKAFPGMKSTGFTAKLDLSSVPDGVHTLSAVSFSSVGASRVIATVPVLTRLAFSRAGPEGTLPFGLLDYPKTDMRVRDKKEPVTALGWAAGPASISRVEISIDGKRAVPAVFVKRPDVMTTYPKLSSTGFTAQLIFSDLENGAHSLICTIFDKAGKSRIFAQVPFSVNSDFKLAAQSGNLPFGTLDTPGDVLTSEGTDFLPVTGWVAAHSNISRVEILLDDKYLEDAPLIIRRDVRAAYPEWKSEGYDDSLDLIKIPLGKHRISIVARTVDGFSRTIGEVSFVRNVS